MTNLPRLDDDACQPEWFRRRRHKPRRDRSNRNLNRGEGLKICLRGSEAVARGHVRETLKRLFRILVECEETVV
jgi:hypothetical protein